jgi:hypothetical protein
MGALSQERTALKKESQREVTIGRAYLDTRGSRGEKKRGRGRDGSFK